MFRSFLPSSSSVPPSPPPLEKKSSIAQELARDQAVLARLYDALAEDVVFRTGPVRVARRDWSVEFLTVGGRIGAWFVENGMLVYLEAEDLSDEMDFVPLQDASKASLKAQEIADAVMLSRSAIAPHMKRDRALSSRRE